MSLVATLGALRDGAALQASDIDDAFAEIMDGVAAHEDIKQFLTLTTPLMGHAPLIAAGARALRSRMVRVDAPVGAIDVCGTGGDGAHTLNISTAVAFVVAGCGVPVAKHGNRAMSSKSGAADVLEALGVKLTADIATLERALREAGVAFLFAQNHHPAMRHVALARRELGKRTIFNLLGPLSNPASVKRQLMGVFSADFLEPVAGALKELGCEKAWVVHGAGGLDELSLAGPSQIVELEDGMLRSFELAPDDLGADLIPVEALRGGDASYNAQTLKTLLTDPHNANPAYLTTVIENSGAALVASGHANDIHEASAQAYEALFNGAAARSLGLLLNVTRAAP